MSDVKILKTITGEELVCNVFEEKEDRYVVDKTNIIQVVNVDEESGALSIRLLPYMISKPDCKHELLKIGIAVPPMDASLDLEKMFIATTSGIELA